jgi:hypothetical protein
VPAAAERKASKMDVAKEVVQGILDKLAPQDSVGIVLFSDGACAPKPLGPVNCTDMAALKKGVEVRAIHSRCCC